MPTPGGSSPKSTVGQPQSAIEQAVIQCLIIPWLTITHSVA